MGRNPKIWWWVCVVVGCCIFTVSFRVEATEGGSDETFAYIFVGEIVSWITSLTFAAENFHSVIKNEQGSAFWRYGGWVVGGINIAGGCVLLLGGRNYGWPDITSWLGITHLAFGAINVGFTIWASSQPERQEQKLSLAPMVMPDVNGNAAFGVGLRLVGW